MPAAAEGPRGGSALRARWEQSQHSFRSQRRQAAISRREEVLSAAKVENVQLKVQCKFLQEQLSAWEQWWHAGNAHEQWQTSRTLEFAGFSPIVHNVQNYMAETLDYNNCMDRETSAITDKECTEYADSDSGGEQHDLRGVTSQKAAITIQSAWRGRMTRRQTLEWTRMDQQHRESCFSQGIGKLTALRQNIISDSRLCVPKHDNDRCQYAALVSHMFKHTICDTKAQARTKLKRDEYNQRYPRMSDGWLWEKICGKYFGDTRDPLLKSDMFLELMWHLHCFLKSGKWGDER